MEGFIRCNVCQKNYAPHAKSCPYCNTKIKKSLDSKVFKATLVIMAVVLLVGYLLTDTRDWTEKIQSDRAYSMMQRFVEQGLSSPLTAVFPSEAEKQTTYLGNQEYEINSWVDSQNIFGAMIRTKFTGTVKQIEKDSWKLMSIQFKK